MNHTKPDRLCPKQMEWSVALSPFFFHIRYLYGVIVPCSKKAVFCDAIK